MYIIYMSNHFKTIIIFDWDNTLFPTKWLTNNNISPNSNNINKFIELDSALSELLISYSNKNGVEIFIVTNATITWITETLKLIPNTKKIINDIGITIISSRDLYSNVSSDAYFWKKRTFQLLINQPNDILYNILSIGDSDYEFRALIDLYYFNKCKYKILKAIKTINDPNYNQTIEQIEILLDNKDYLINTLKHMDLNIG